MRQALSSTDTPFRLGTGVQDVFAHESWRAAERQVLCSLAEGHSVALSGPSGVGKSLMMRSLRHAFAAGGVSVQVLVSDGEPDPEAEIVLADEIGAVADDMLRRLLCRERPVVLAGLPESAARLSAAGGLVGTVSMGLLSAAATGDYIRSRLVRAGRPADLFTPAALAAVSLWSEGLFRTVVMLAGAALFAAEFRGAARVAESDVDEAVSMRAGIAATDPPCAPVRPRLERLPVLS